MDHAIPRHPRGGPFPHLQGGYHADLPPVIQHARGLIHTGTEPMEVGRFIAEQTHTLALSLDDLRCALGYLLSAAISAGRLAAIRTRMEMGIPPAPSAADLLEVMEALGVVRCRDCGDVALDEHRCPDQRVASAPEAQAAPNRTHAPQSIALLRYVAARDPLAAAQMAAAREQEQERAPRAEAQPLSAAPPAAEDNATGGCRPGGPYCPGMNAALDAAAKGGLAAGSLLKIGGAAEPPEVIIHRGVINGERRQLLLQCCPFCRAELEPRRTLVAAAPSAEGTLLAGASPAPDGQAVQAGEAEEAQGRAPAKVSPRDIWRAPTLVNWCLLGGDSSEDPEEAARADAARDKAEADLDAAFAKTSAWLRAQLQAGRRDALDEAFDDHLGPVMLAHIRSGAMDTEPCANVRLALREVAGQCQAQLDQTAEES